VKPSQEEIDAWDERVLQILKDLEEMKDPNNDDDNGVNQKDLGKNDVINAAGFDRNGQPSKSYRKSLPPFIQAAADGNLTLLKEMVAEVKMRKQMKSALSAVWDRYVIVTSSTAEHWVVGMSSQVLGQKSMSPSEKKEYIGRVQMSRTRRRDGKTRLHHRSKRALDASNS
jgi:hypothetical protein